MRHKALLILGLSALIGAQTLPPIPTRGGSNLREHVYQEIALTPASVLARGLRQYFTLPMEGDARGAESQPLVMPGVTMQDGSKRDICIVSTMNNLVWAYDINTSDILWVQKTGIPVNGSRAIDFWFLNDHWGILSTGVIDTDTQIWYGVEWASPDGSAAKAKHYLVALNLKDGSQLFPPQQLPAQYDAVMRKQRSSLALATLGGRKALVFASGTVLETSGTAAGYLTAYDLDTRAFALLPMAKAGGGAGVWMGGGGVVIDGENIFGVTGNGTFNPAAGDWGETAFRATLTPSTAPLKTAVLDGYCVSNDATGAAQGIVACPVGPNNITLTATERPMVFTVADWFTPYTDAWRVTNSNAVTLKSSERLAGHSKSTEPGEGTPAPVNLMPGDMVAHEMPQGMVMSDEDLGSAPPAYIKDYGVLLVAGKDGIGYSVNAKDMGKSVLSDAVDSAANFAKLLWPPFWYGAYAGNGVSPAPVFAQTLNNNVFFDGKTHHLHSASVVYHSKNNGIMVFSGAENSNVRAWRVNPDGSFAYLANADDVASPDLANTPPGGMTGSEMCATTSGLLIAIQPHGDANNTITKGRIMIYDAENIATRPDGSKQLRLLWNSDQHGISFNFNKFCPPIVYNGKLIVPTYDDQTLVLGLN